MFLRLELTCIEIGKLPFDELTAAENNETQCFLDSKLFTALPPALLMHLLLRRKPEATDFL